MRPRVRSPLEVCCFFRTNAPPLFSIHELPLWLFTRIRVLEGLEKFLEGKWPWEPKKILFAQRHLQFLPQKRQLKKKQLFLKIGQQVLPLDCTEYLCFFLRCWNWKILQWKERGKKRSYFVLRLLLAALLKSITWFYTFLCRS